MSAMTRTRQSSMPMPLQPNRDRKRGGYPPSQPDREVSVLKQVIALIMVSLVFIVYMFQPFYNEIFHLRNLALQVTLDNAIEKAAVEGRFSNETVNEMKATMVDRLHYSSGDVSFCGTTKLTPRGNYVEGTLGIPAGQLWVLPNIMGGSSDVRELRAYAKQMSEYIPR